MNELISVIVPIYNVDKYLERCIDSIINQTYKNLEIILVDDGSTDDCPRICDEYQKKDSRIKVIHKENGGLSDTRNKGIDIAKGKYYGFIDSDDYIDADMYAILYKNIVETHSDIAVCGRYIDYEDGNTKKMTNENRSNILMDRIEALKKLNNYSDFDMSACDKLYSAKLWKDIRYPYGKICEDYYTTYKLFDKSNKVVFVPKALYHYFQRNNSLSRNKKITEHYINGSIDQLEYFEKNIPELLYVAKSSYAFSNIATYNNYLKNKQKCPRLTRKKYQKNVKDNLNYIIKNDSLSKTKKFKLMYFLIV